MRRSPHGERGLKFFYSLAIMGARNSRSPHGERGLKFWLLTAGCFGVGVAPRTGSVD